MERLEELFARYGDTVYRLALHSGAAPADAQDICQNVFIKLMANLDRIHAGKEKAWLCKVTVNECRNWHRSGWRQNVQPLDETLPAASDESRAVWQSVLALPEKYRTCVYLHYFEGYSVKETASLLGIRPSAVTTRLQRARAKLKEALE